MRYFEFIQNDANSSKSCLFETRRVLCSGTKISNSATQMWFEWNNKPWMGEKKICKMSTLNLYFN